MNPPAERIRVNRRFYLPWLSGARRILDVGCGDGIFLDLLCASGAGVQGIEKDPSAVRACRAKGLSCAESEALPWLSTCAERFDAVLLTHVLEHHPAPEASRLVAACAGVMNPGAVLLVVVPNPHDHFVVLRDFPADPTHVRMYDAGEIRTFARDAGLETRIQGEHPGTALDGLAWPRRLAGLLTKTLNRFRGRRVFCGDLYAVLTKRD